MGRLFGKVADRCSGVFLFLIHHVTYDAAPPACACDLHQRLASAKCSSDWMKFHFVIEWENGTRATRVPQVGKICAGRTGSVDMDHGLAPIGEHMVLAMRRFHDDCIKAARILSERIEERSVVKAHRPTADR